MSIPLKRLYIFTGKGGVGKTTLSLAFTRWLKERNTKAIYLTLSQQAISDETALFSDKLPEGWQMVPHQHLELEACAEDYITKKLGSGMLAKWIVRTAFFRALVNMLPGFGYVISLGKMLEMLKDDPQLVIVLDAPASGHALTMLEATSNFREIFQAGLVFDDTEKMLSRLYDSAHTGVRILTLPTTLALSEGIELRGAIATLAPLEAKIFLNHSLKNWKTELATAPEALKQKLALEEEALQTHSPDIAGTFGYCASLDAEGLYRQLSPQLEVLA
jgi:arsenite-transporting ATPase